MFHIFLRFGQSILNYFNIRTYLFTSNIIERQRLTPVNNSQNLISSVIPKKIIPLQKFANNKHFKREK